MVIGLCIGISIGLSLGITFLLWFVTGNHLKLDLVTAQPIDDDFSERTKFWANLSVGDAQVDYLKDADCAGESFARLQLNRAEKDQLALAQLDDYAYRPRADFNWQPPLAIEVRMRFSAQNGAGTAGFYLWNNPIGLGSEMPNIRPLKWMGFYRVPPDGYMNFSDQTDNFRASVFEMGWRDIFAFLPVPFSPKLRIQEVGLDERGDWTQWHTYRIEWLADKVNLAIDDEIIVSYDGAIKGPLALVLWYDNNYPHLNLRKFDLTFSDMDVPAWLDIDFVKIRPLN